LEKDWNLRKGLNGPTPFTVWPSPTSNRLEAVWPKAHQGKSPMRAWPRPTGPPLPPISTTPRCPRRLMCADSRCPYPLSAECKAALAFLLLARFSATPHHFPSSPSCPAPISPRVADPAADEPPQAPLSHRPSVPRVIIDWSVTVSQAVPSRSRQSRADTVRPGREGTAPSTLHLRLSPGQPTVPRPLPCPRAARRQLQLQPPLLLRPFTSEPPSVDHPPP
jgi:hypothetical protein